MINKNTTETYFQKKKTHNRTCKVGTIRNDNYSFLPLATACSRKKIILKHYTTICCKREKKILKINTGGMCSAGQTEVQKIKC